MDAYAKIAYIALGANLGLREAALRRATEQLDAHDQLTVRRTSPVYETAAHTLSPDEAQPSFLNAVVEVQTALAPEQLLALCHDLEQAAGRVRRQQWMARPLDLDLIVYGRETRHAPGLVLPHPRMAERRFVLQPLADLASNLYVPSPFETTVAELLAHCPDTEIPVRTLHRLHQPR